MSLVASMRGAYRVATGQMVRIEGLKNDQKYNGKAGVVLNENCGKPTCVVLLASGDKLLCRKNNLRPMGPTPEDVKGSKKESLEEEDYGLIQVPNSPVTMPSPEGEGEPPAIEKGREEREESGQVAIGSRPTLMRVLERLIPNSYTSELKLNRITPRLLTVGLAAAKGKGVGKKVGEWLRENCGKGRFMVYNLTKSAYDYSNLDFRVVHYPSPVFPTLPANKMLGLCKSISSWLALDAQHVAVLQCRTGRGRSACAAACYLHYSHRFRFPNIERALAHVARVRGIPLRKLINPTQKRFARYFSLLLKRLKRSKSAESKNPGIPKKPNETIPSLRLDRIIINVAPEVEKGGIRPVVQVFSEEKMVYDGISSSFESGQGMETLLNAGSTGKVEIGAQVSGPFLVRLCHLPTQSIAHKPSASAENLDQKKNEINESAPLRAPCLVRVGLDTEFLSTGVERLGVGKVDVAFSAVRRLSPEFFLDLIFSTPPTPPIQQNSNKSYIPSPPSPPPRRSPSKFTNSSPTPLSKPRLEDKSEKNGPRYEIRYYRPAPTNRRPCKPTPPHVSGGSREGPHVSR
uniref:Phosphatase tensin-type domain-containing protein n=1 Tax=Amorphochlora amoebiformis TaxID=1561963 RepID=A0A7S0GWK7_9EUKA